MYRYYELGKKRRLFRGGYWDPFLRFLSTRCEVNTRCKPGALAYGLGCRVGVLDQNQFKHLRFQGYLESCLLVRRVLKGISAAPLLAKDVAFL